MTKRPGSLGVGTQSTALLGLLLSGPLALPCRAQTDTSAVAPPTMPAAAPAVVLTLTGGLGAPYGNGLDVGYRLSRRVDATVGGGYDGSGVKAGVGLRVDMLTERKATTFAGVNLAYSGGQQEILVQTDEDRAGQRETARIRLRPCTVARLRVGVRWQPTPRLALLTALGQGLVLGATPVQYLDGASPSEGLRAVVDRR